jgi:hypothetical protein
MERLREEQGLPSHERPRELVEEEHELQQQLRVAAERRAEAEARERAAVDALAAADAHFAAKKAQVQAQTVVPYLKRTEAEVGMHLPRAFGGR